MIKIKKNRIEILNKVDIIWGPYLGNKNWFVCFKQMPHWFKIVDIGIANHLFAIFWLNK